jgi:predicted transcriptional regulator
MKLWKTQFPDFQHGTECLNRYLAIDIMSSMSRRKLRRRTVKILVSLPDGLVEDLDALADEVDADRSDVIEELLRYAFEHVDEIFPPEEEEEEEGEEEEEET